MSSVDALREAAAAILDARGAGAEARIVRRGTLAMLGERRRWSVGSREVDALGFELALDPADHVALRAATAGEGRVRDALADAVASPSTMLSDLFIVVRLPGLEQPWGSIYRTAPARPREAPADEDAVRAAAVALLEAEGHGEAAALLGRAELAAAEIPSSGASVLRRWVVRLTPTDAAAALRRGRDDAIRRAVAVAATRAAEVVAGVDVAVGPGQDGG
jgi:hypothetical protein